MSFKPALMASAISMLFCAPAYAVTDADFDALKNEISQMKAAYEARIADLEARVKEAEAKSASASQTAVSAAQSADAATQVANAAAQAAAVPPPAPPARANSFNPAISMILDGGYANLGKGSSDQIQGFLTPAGQDRPPKGFSVGGTEVSLAANIDPMFKGFANITYDDTAVSVEEAWFQTIGLGHGFNIKGGRFLSALGYQNEQHAHMWDFVDNNLVYKSLFGEHYVEDGVQLKWLAPTDLLVEPFLEVGRGANFPGSDRNKNGAGAITAGVHVGGDLDESNSWRGGVSYFTTHSTKRGFSGADPSGIDVNGDFNGHTKIWLADFVWKWAPEGNPYERNFKFATEIFHRDENGALNCADAVAGSGSSCGAGLSGPYVSSQSGMYVQGAYQFMPHVRVGYRYDRLWRGSADFSGADVGGTIATLGDYNPSRHSVMFDWAPSEFSLLRLQYSLDKSMQGQNENQWFLQYVYSLGSHGAHQF